MVKRVKTIGIYLQYFISIDRQALIRSLEMSTYLVKLIFVLNFLLTPAFLLISGKAEAASDIALVISKSGTSAAITKDVEKGAILAIENANSNIDKTQETFNLNTYDDKGEALVSASTAKQIAESNALVVIGPIMSPLAFAACPVYEKSGIAALIPATLSDDLSKYSSTFRIGFSIRDLEDFIINYSHRILNNSRAIVIAKDNFYNKSLYKDLNNRRSAKLMEITTEFYGSTSELISIARNATFKSDNPLVVLAMNHDDTIVAVKELKNMNFKGNVLTTATQTHSNFIEQLSEKENSEGLEPGYYSNGLLVVTPMVIDAANADVLEFAHKYKNRFGEEPSSDAVRGYDAARLAITAIQKTAKDFKQENENLNERRRAILQYLLSLDSPSHSVLGLTYPIWFTENRGRQQPIKIGVYNNKILESAPIQLVREYHPDPSELASGTVLDFGYNQFFRLQQVVSAGIHLNEIRSIDPVQSKFSADFFVWLRYQKNHKYFQGNPLDIEFPDLLRGEFDINRPAESVDLSDGTTFRLWRVQGEIKNDFNFQLYPFDKQTLSIRFVNAHAASQQIIYTRDREVSDREFKFKSFPSGVRGVNSKNNYVSPEKNNEFLSANEDSTLKALKNLTQWAAKSIESRQDTLITNSALGNPLRYGVNNRREVSGFLTNVVVSRNVLSNLIKSLLPLFLLTTITFSSLFFPPGLVKEKITVAISSLLSAIILLSSINSQLGNVGYVLLVEYAFYSFFLLCLISIISVLFAERLRYRKREGRALLIETCTKIIYLTIVIGVIIVGLSYSHFSPNLASSL